MTTDAQIDAKVRHIIDGAESRMTDTDTQKLAAATIAK